MNQSIIMTTREELSDLISTFRESLVTDEASALPSIEWKMLEEYIVAFTRIWECESDMMKCEMRNIWIINCNGILIKGKIYCSRVVGKIGPISFRGAIFDGEVRFDNIQFLAQCDFSDSQFLHSVNFRGSEFNGQATFNRAKFGEHVDFSMTTFRYCAEFQKITLSAASINFAYATFYRAPLFHESKLPQGTSFDETRFVLNTNDDAALLAQDALAFRTLKQLASSYRGQQDEADFFSYEQTARRVAFMTPRLIWKYERYDHQCSLLKQLFRAETWRNWNSWTIRIKLIEWALSIAYDSISGYGRKMSRSIEWLLIVNLVLVLLFRFNYCFGNCKAAVDYCTLNSSTSSFAYQHPAAQLAIQNILNPVALASEKAVIYVHSPSMLALSIFQFVATYLILFLLALSVRTRFQKGSGGER